MSRSGYAEDCWYDNPWQAICHRGAVKSAMKGKRGQAFLKELGSAMDNMEVKELYSNMFAKDDCFCALGVVGNKRNIDMSEMDEYDLEHSIIAEKFGVATAMAREIMWENDDGTCYIETPKQRWQRMREWVRANTL